MSLRNMLSPANSEEGGNNQGTGNQQTAATKAKRGRKKANPATAIAKSEGHQLANDQRQEASELITGLERQEQVYTAARGYQKGQNLANIELAAKIAGVSDTLTEAALDRIEALKSSLNDGLQNHNPLDVLDELGLLRNKEETNELRQKTVDLDTDDVSHFLL